MSLCSPLCCPRPFLMITLVSLSNVRRPLYHSVGPWIDLAACEAAALEEGFSQFGQVKVSEQVSECWAGDSVATYFPTSDISANPGSCPFTTQSTYSHLPFTHYLPLLSHVPFVRFLCPPYYSFSSTVSLISSHFLS